MDPLSFIVAALSAGLAAGVTETATSAIKDAYQSLKKRLTEKTAGKEGVQTALSELEKKPESQGRQEVLKEELQNEGIERDDEVLALAKELMQKLEAAQPGKYNIAIKHAQGLVIGDNAQVQQIFNSDSKHEQE